MIPAGSLAGLSGAIPHHYGKGMDMKNDDGTALVALALRAASPGVLRLAVANAALRIVAAYERETGKTMNDEETTSAANLTVMLMLKDAINDQKRQREAAQQPPRTTPGGGDEAPEDKATPAQRADAERDAAALFGRLRVIPGGKGQQPQQPSA